MLVVTDANATAFYGRAALNGSVISEWGLSTFNSAEGSTRINSPELMLELVRMLVRHLIVFSELVNRKMVHLPLLSIEKLQTYKQMAGVCCGRWSGGVQRALLDG